MGRGAYGLSCSSLCFLRAAGSVRQRWREQRFRHNKLNYIIYRGTENMRQRAVRSDRRTSEPW